MLYILVIIAIGISGLFIGRYSYISIGNKYSTRSCYVFFWGIVLTALVCMRSYKIGNDTLMYKSIFDGMALNSNFFDWINTAEYASQDYCFYAMMYIVSRFASYRLFLCICAIISVYPAIYIIYKYSKKPTLSLILYINFNYYVFTMSGLRQACAMGLVFLAYDQMKKHNLKKYLILCFIALTFHITALLFLPVYWIKKLKNNFKTRLLFISAIAIVFLTRNKIWKFLVSLSRVKYQSSDSGGYFMLVFMILSALLGFIYARMFKEKTTSLLTEDDLDIDYKELLYLQLLAIALWPLSNLNMAVARIYYYYHMFIILYVPCVLSVIEDRVIRTIITWGFLIVGLYFMLHINFNPSAHYNPYLFFWQ